MLQPAVSYIGTALRFYKKQPLLNPVVGLLLVLPYVIASGFDMAMSAFSTSIQNTFGMSAMQVQVLYFVVQLLLTLWIIWGIAAVMSIGMRLIKSAAGRTKSSLQSVVKQSRTLILPFFFTGLIRDCITLLLVLPYCIAVTAYLLTQPADELNAFIATLKETVIQQSQTAEFNSTIALVMLVLLPLLLPVIYYRVNTSFYQVVILNEKIGYRNALKKSSSYVKPKFWLVLLKMLVIALCTFIPISIIISIIDGGLSMFDERLLPLVPLISGIGIAFATAIFSLALMALYKDLLPKK